MKLPYWLHTILWPALCIFSGLLILPFSYNLSYLMFAAIGILGLYVVFTARGRFPVALLVSLLAATCLFAASALVFRMFEGGFDDGPFYVYSAAPLPDELGCSETVDLEEHSFCIQNPSLNGRSPLPEHAGDPRLSLRSADGPSAWSVRFNTSSKMPGTTITYIRSAEFHEGWLRNRLEFVGCWSYGCEAGVLYLTKWNTPIRYYLSW